MFCQGLGRVVDLSGTPQLRHDLRGRGKCLDRIQDWSLRVKARYLVALLDAGPGLLQQIHNAGWRGNHALLRQVVKQSGGRVKK